MLRVNGSRGTFLNFHWAYIGLIGFLDSVFFTVHVHTLCLPVLSTRPQSLTWTGNNDEKKVKASKYKLPLGNVNQRLRSRWTRTFWRPSNKMDTEGSRQSARSLRATFDARATTMTAILSYINRWKLFMRTPTPSTNGGLSQRKVLQMERNCVRKSSLEEQVVLKRPTLMLQKKMPLHRPSPPRKNVCVFFHFFRQKKWWIKLSIKTVSKRKSFNLTWPLVSKHKRNAM